MSYRRVDLTNHDPQVQRVIGAAFTFATGRQYLSEFHLLLGFWQQSQRHRPALVTAGWSRNAAELRAAEVPAAVEDEIVDYSESVAKIINESGFTAEELFDGLLRALGPGTGDTTASQERDYPENQPGIIYDVLPASRPTAYIIPRSKRSDAQQKTFNLSAWDDHSRFSAAPGAPAAAKPAAPI